MKEKASIVQPGRLLKIFFATVVFSFLVFVSWEFYFTKHWLVFGVRAPKLEPSNWLFLIGGVFAIAGWVCSSLVTLRNSIKQHTFNIFIQSRLSSPYAEVIRRVNSKYFSLDSIDGPLNLAELLQPESSQLLHDIGMVLNYFEFMAIGVRYGDLDEFILKQIMRSIVTGFVTKVNPYIDHIRKKIR